MERVSRHDCCQWRGISRNDGFQLCEVRRNVAETHRKIIVLSWKELDLKAYGPERPRGSWLFVWFYITIVDTFPYNLHGYLYYCWYISIQFKCLFVVFLLQFHIFCMRIWIIVDTFPYNLHAYLYYFCYNFIMFTCLFVLLLIHFHANYIHICIILFHFMNFTCLFVLLLIYFHTIYMFICIIFATIS